MTRVPSLRRAGALGAVAGLGLGVHVGTASASPVTYWGCHGPTGQPLGSAPFVAQASGDGITSAACDVAGTTLDAGGLRAGFPRTDPLAGSAARWQSEIPSGLAVSEVRLLRRTGGFGATPVPGGGLTYRAETAQGPLESSSVEDATDVPRDGVAVLPTTGGTYLRFGTSCGATASGRCAAPTADPVSVDVGSVAVRADDASAPRGAVGGISSPAAGTSVLGLRISDDGTGLARAEVRLDGAVVATSDLGGPDCADLSPADPQVDLALGAGCPASADDVELPLVTTRYPDGVHQLRVSATDAAGNVAVLADQAVTFRNAPPEGQSTAVLTVGTPQQSSAASGSAASSGGVRPTGVGTPADEPACASPRLTMFLQQRPLRVVRGVPQLGRDRRYRFGGQLTCVIDGRRRRAPSGVSVALYNVIRGRTYGKGGFTTRAGGRLSLILSYPSSRVLEFRRTSGTATSRVRIRIGVVRVVKRPTKAAR